MNIKERAIIWGYNTRYTESEEEAFEIIKQLLAERDVLLSKINQPNIRTPQMNDEVYRDE